MVLIQATAVSKHYPVRTGRLLQRRTLPLRAVDRVDLTVEAGETLGLVGESGCGKSTLGRLLINLIPLTGGQVTLDGADITAMSSRELREARRSMQIIFQDPYGSLNPRMTVEEIIKEPLQIHGGASARDMRAKVAEMLELVGLPARSISRYPHEFSGGQRQRIGIARALVLRPRLVVCDEPVSALDVSVQAQIVNLLRDLQHELGLTYLFIAHDLGIVKHISDRVAVMYLGRVVELAPKRVLYEAPRHPYTQALIASVPISHPRQRRRTDRATRTLPGDIPSPLSAPPGCTFHTRCSHVMPLCREQEPSLRALPDGRLVACHLKM